MGQSFIQQMQQMQRPGRIEAQRIVMANKGGSQTMCRIANMDKVFGPAPVSQSHGTMVFSGGKQDREGLPL